MRHLLGSFLIGVVFFTGIANSEAVKAVYEDENLRLNVNLERVDVVLKSDEVLNYPGLIEFSDDILILPYGKGIHGGDEIRTSAISKDGGKTWKDVESNSPFADNVQISGQIGYLSDHTVLYVDAIPLEAEKIQAKGMYYQVKRIKEPHWRVRHFSSDAKLIEEFKTNLTGLLWKEAAYLSYGNIIELSDGNLIAAFECVTEMPKKKGENWNYYAKTLIARSTDGGREFKLISIIEDKVGEHGLFNADLVKLANGDLLCVMRTGSKSMLYQSLSKDNGKSWTKPKPTGWWGVKPSLRLLDNGVLVCTSGRGPFGNPYATYAMFSLDGTGKKWEYPFILNSGPGCGYTSNLEKDGKLYVYFSHSAYTNPVGTYNLPYQSIKCAVLNVERVSK